MHRARRDGMPRTASCLIPCWCSCRRPCFRWNAGDGRMLSIDAPARRRSIERPDILKLRLLRVTFVILAELLLRLRHNVGERQNMSSVAYLLLSPAKPV